MKTWCITVLAGWALCGGSLLAQIPDEANRYTEHLEFLGYTTSLGENYILAKHQGQAANVSLKRYVGGVLLTAMFTLSDEGKRPSNRAEVLEMANALTKEAAVSRFYIDSDETLTIEAWYQPPYDRARFGKLLQEWHRDTNDKFLIRPEIKRFLK